MASLEESIKAVRDANIDLLTVRAHLFTLEIALERGKVEDAKKLVASIKEELSKNIEGIGKALNGELE